MRLINASFHAFSIEQPVLFGTCHWQMNDRQFDNLVLQFLFYFRRHRFDGSFVIGIHQRRLDFEIRENWIDPVGMITAGTVTTVFHNQLQYIHTGYIQRYVARLFTTTHHSTVIHFLSITHQAENNAAFPQRAVAGTYSDKLFLSTCTVRTVEQHGAVRHRYLVKISILIIYRLVVHSNLAGKCTGLFP